MLAASHNCQPQLQNTVTCTQSLQSMRLIIRHWKGKFLILIKF